MPSLKTRLDFEIAQLDQDVSSNQPLDATLTALAGLNSTDGLVEQTGADAFTKRAIGVAASTSILTRADGDARYTAHPGYVSGLYYAPARNLTGGSAVAANILYAVPCFIHEAITIQALTLRTTAFVAASNAKLGIYANSGGRPGSLVVQTASPVATSANATVAGALTSNTLLQPGWYWLASLFSHTPSTLCILGNDQMFSEVIGSPTASETFASSSAGTLGVTGVHGTATYAGGLPDPFGTATVRAGGAVTPVVGFQIA